MLLRHISVELGGSSHDIVSLPLPFIPFKASTFLKMASTSQLLLAVLHTVAIPNGKSNCFLLYHFTHLPLLTTPLSELTFSTKDFYAYYIIGRCNTYAISQSTFSKYPVART